MDKTREDFFQLTYVVIADDYVDVVLPDRVNVQRSDGDQMDGFTDRHRTPPGSQSGERLKWDEREIDIEVEIGGVERRTAVVQSAAAASTVVIS